jgi:sporulation protein YlmC with PRC-barrel domain
MKHLVATTALSLILSAPAMAQTAQDQTGQGETAQGQVAEEGQLQEQAAAENGFLQRLETQDVLVGELLGQDVYALAAEPEDDRIAIEEEQDAVAAAPDEETDAARAEDGLEPERQAEAEGVDVDVEIDDDQVRLEVEIDVDQTGTVPEEEDAAFERSPGDPEATAEDRQAQPPEQQDEQLAEDREAQQLAEDPEARRDRDMQPMDEARLEDMDNIGQVNEVIVDQQGDIQGIVVGGFLGDAEQEVAIDFERVDITRDEQDPQQYYVVADMSVQQMQDAPSFEYAMADEEARVDEEARADEQARADEERQEEQLARADEQEMADDRADTEWRQEREAFTTPDQEREGFQRADVAEISADELIGSNLYDVNDDNIGSVDDVVLDEEGEASHLIVDIGGFLGIGTHTVALGFDEISVLRDDGWDEFRIYVEATEDQLEQLPEYAER